MFCGFMYLVTNGRISFFWMLNNIHCVYVYIDYISLSFHLLTEGCFHILAIVINNSQTEFWLLWKILISFSLDTHTHTPSHTHIYIYLSIHISPVVAMVDHKSGIKLSLIFEELLYCFPQWLCWLTFPPAVHKGSLFPTPSPTLTSYLFDGSHFTHV